MTTVPPLHLMPGSKKREALPDQADEAPAPSARTRRAPEDYSPQSVRKHRQVPQWRTQKAVPDYQPRGVLLRWRHCWFDLNGFFVTPVAWKAGDTIRRGSGGLKVTALAPKAVMASLGSDERRRIAAARRSYARALARVVGQPRSGGAGDAGPAA